MKKIQLLRKDKATTTSLLMSYYFEHEDMCITLIKLKLNYAL